MQVATTIKEIFDCADWSANAWQGFLRVIVHNINIKTRQSKDGNVHKKNTIYSNRKL